LRNGKFFAPCSDSVNTVGSSRKIAAVPLPWCTSRSITSTRSRPAVAAVPLGLHQPRRHGHVVEHAVARALVRIGVVRAAGQVGGHALAANSAVRAAAMVAPTERRARSTMRSLHGKPISRCCAALVVPSATASIHAGSCASASSPSLAGGRLGHAQPGRWRLGGLAQQPVLAHRKAVPGRQRQHEVVGVEGPHGGGF
jgi:hypothetical protein